MHRRLVLGDDGNDDSLQMFSLAAAAMNVSASSCADDDRHALLRLGDGKLGAVQTVVLLRNGVQVDVQAVGQLADGDRNAARAEVVAAA